MTQRPPASVLGARQDNGTAVGQAADETMGVLSGTGSERAAAQHEARPEEPRQQDGTQAQRPQQQDGLVCTICRLPSCWQ